jgi:hypothetical protein
MGANAQIWWAWPDSVEDLAKSDGGRLDPMEASRIRWRSVSAAPVRPTPPFSLTLPLFISLTRPSQPFVDLEPTLTTAAGRTLELARTILYKKLFYAWDIDLLNIEMRFGRLTEGVASEPFPRWRAK